MAEDGRICAVILAAGKSERMEYPKALLIFGKETVVDRLIRLCAESGCDPIVVVLGHDAERIRANAALANATVVVNADHDKGQTSSLQAGLRALPDDVGACVLFPVDHALVESATLGSLISEWRRARRGVVVPVREGRRGHPVVIDRALIPELLALSPETPARAVTVADPSRITSVETADTEVLRDLDTPADYHDALEVYSARGGEAGFLAPKGAAGRPAPKKPPV